MFIIKNILYLCNIIVHIHSMPGNTCLTQWSQSFTKHKETMATRGRNICNTLKAIRKQIAEANGINYSPEECHFEGECKGTCPKCEQDVRDLEYELHLKEMAGKAIKVAGIAVGLVTITACSDASNQKASKPSENEEVMLLGGKDAIEVIPDSSTYDSSEDLPSTSCKNQTNQNSASHQQVLSSNKFSHKEKFVTDISRSDLIPPAPEAPTSPLPTSDNKVGMIDEELPSFPGGIEALQKYITNNLRYPELAGDGVKQGRVVLGIVVNEDGSIGDVKVTKSLAPAYDKEAVKVIRNMPKWNPGKQNGKAIKARYTIPIFFSTE